MEHYGNKPLRQVGNHLPDDMASCPGTPQRQLFRLVYIDRQTTILGFYTAFLNVFDISGRTRFIV